MRTYDGAQLSIDAAGGTYRIDRDANGTVEFTMPDPDFAVREFRSNTVLRWEYRPGSTLFLAWSQSRDDRTFVPVAVHCRTMRGGFSVWCRATSFSSR